VGANKILRRAVLLPTMILPKSSRAAWYGWVKGRHEYRKLRQADYVIVSFPQSGRTWLRTMLTRFYQARYGIDEMRLLGLKNLNKLDPQIPKVFFTHDHYIRDYTGHRDSKADFADKKIVLLVRDPRDTAVSSYHSLKYRPNPTRKGLNEIEADGDNAPAPFEYMQFRAGWAVDFMNSWQEELADPARRLLVRYEDLRAEPAVHLRQVLEFLDANPTPAEIAEAVEFASFDNMRKLEETAAFGSDDRRIVPGEASNPESFKVRRGKVGGYRDYLSAEEAAALDQLVAAKLSPAFGYGAR
jgi:Sulfotransferase domain